MKVLLNIESFIFKCFRLIAETPTTSIRMWVTLALSLATGAKYLSYQCTIQNNMCITWVPADSWLMFLAALGGIDLAQFTAKRMTAWRPSESDSESSSEPSSPAATPTNHDIG
jgi:hypothetical protein